LLQDIWLIEKLARFDCDVIPSSTSTPRALIDDIVKN